MTEHDDDLTTKLTRSLTDRSDVMSGTSFGLAEVKGRARSLRRRRMATAVVGAAAAVAVIIPTVALASHTGGSNNEPAPITQTPSPTQAATARIAAMAHAGRDGNSSEIRATATPASSATKGSTGLR